MSGKLTGNTRYRAGLFGRLILQVEEVRTRTDWRTCEEDQFTAWRDANVMDMAAGAALQQGAPDHG